jgi:hypothetical protein
LFTFCSDRPSFSAVSPSERKGGRPAPAEPYQQVGFRVPRSKRDLVEKIVAAWGDKAREAAGIDLPASSLSANAWFQAILDREAKAYGLVESEAAPPPAAPPKRAKGRR